LPTIFVDRALTEDERRRRLYRGDLVTFSAGTSSTKLAELAQELSETAFSPYDPQVAQESMSAERYVEILAELKPRFIHHPRAKDYISGMLEELGCDIEEMYFDVPALAHDGTLRVPEGRLGLSVPRTPRHLVLGSLPAAQLVAAGLWNRL
jgi:hypothetical protein